MLDWLAKVYRMLDKPPEYYSFQRPEMMPFLPNHYTHVIDVGCGEGRFLALLNADAERWGVEPNEIAAEKAEALGFKVLNARYEDCENLIPNAYFDLVTCNDVIEHLIDHDYFLFSIGNKLKDGGVLVGSVPNMRYYKILINLLLHSDFRYEPIGVMDVTHLRWFTERSLRRSLTNSGFTVEMIRGIKSAIAGSPPAATRRHLFLMGFLSTVTRGRTDDIQYMQLAFRARKVLR